MTSYWALRCFLTGMAAMRADLREYVRAVGQQLRERRGSRLASLGFRGRLQTGMHQGGASSGGMGVMATLGEVCSSPYLRSHHGPSCWAEEGMASSTLLATTLAGWTGPTSLEFPYWETCSGPTLLGSPSWESCHPHLPGATRSQTPARIYSFPQGGLLGRGPMLHVGKVRPGLRFSAAGSH